MEMIPTESIAFYTVTIDQHDTDNWEQTYAFEYRCFAEEFAEMARQKLYPNYPDFAGSEYTVRCPYKDFIRDSAEEAFNILLEEIEE